MPAPAPPAEPRASTVENSALLAGGVSLFGVGDVASAGLFYARAADAGDSQAALRLGETYDPLFIVRARLNGCAAISPWRRVGIDAPATSGRERQKSF
jgi:hypothetical protein